MKKLLKSFSYAFKGIIYAFRTQVNFKIHLVAAATVTLAGFYLNLNNVEWSILAGCIGLVLVVELINTAIEVLVDLVSPAYNKKAGIVKDISAGAVLLAAIIAVIVAAFIFVPKVGLASFLPLSFYPSPSGLCAARYYENDWRTAV